MSEKHLVETVNVVFETLDEAAPGTTRYEGINSPVSWNPLNILVGLACGAAAGLVVGVIAYLLVYAAF